ncbi:hypothetical protein, partial [Desulfobulbus alkaliphilus]|uniref:hypothetical protein n=1 Tax=Desulfobulbus alkaliphilus TaxID=869814 RepID=UPI001962E023
MVDFKKSIKKPETIVSLCLLVLLGSVFLTHPFLRIPFDPWEHLIKIRSIYDTGTCFLYWPEYGSSYCSWHFSWAKLFGFFGINNSFHWAYIIHFAQSIFSIISVYYFAFTVFRLCNIRTTHIELQILAFFATIFWLTGNGTFSIDRQQAWLIWYSLTYQGLTVPLFWLMVAWLLKILFNDIPSTFFKFFYAVLIFFSFFVLLFFHPTEAAFFLIYFVIIFVFSPSALSIK